jgi:hypothetical protein
MQTKINSSAILARSFLAVLQTAIFEYLKPRALLWAVALSAFQADSSKVFVQSEGIKVQEPRATPWGCLRAYWTAGIIVNFS